MLVKSKQDNKIFPVIIEESEDGGFVVTNPAFEGCYSQGETLEEALQNIQEATEICLEEVEERKEPVILKNISLHLINIKSNA